jgi:hypothetical protein
MRQMLPALHDEELGPTRDRLRDAALVLSSLQRAFVPKHPRDWQYGLEVNMRGLSTQPFTVDGEEVRATLDLVRHKVRLGNERWSLKYTDGPELLAEIKVWLLAAGADVELEEPAFSDSSGFDPEQAAHYAEALWWLEEQFRELKVELTEGVTSPILLYPHHFDLSLVWFPHDDERQLAIGWSTGDEIIPEPYLYLNAYPEPDGFTKLSLPAAAHWQTKGFSGAVLPYAALAASKEPAALFKQVAVETFKQAHSLLG